MVILLGDTSSDSSTKYVYIYIYIYCYRGNHSPYQRSVYHSDSQTAMGKLCRNVAATAVIIGMAIWVFVGQTQTGDILVEKSTSVLTRQPCSFSWLKETFLKDGFFPNDTSWTAKKKLVSKSCDFASDKVTLQKCLVSKGI